MAPVQILGLNHDEQSLLDELLAQLTAKWQRNVTRAAYYDAHITFQNLGISIPPTFQRVRTVLGWPAKAVDVLSRRCNLDGFALPSGDLDAWGIEELWQANNMDSEASQAGTSSLIHGVSWLIATKGDTAADEPDVVVTARDAMSGTGLWDPRRRRLRAFLSVIDRDGNDPTEMVLYTPDGHVSMVRRANMTWLIERVPHKLGRVPVEPLVYRPRLGRPLGSSRISRAVMSLTDMALRTVIRSEVSAEFYSAPQRYLLGADEKAFVDAAGNVKSQWQAVMGRVWAIDRDEDGNLPSVGQFPQMSQAPHMEQLRALAQLFAGETSIPVSSLGISTEANPASAEAYRASRDDLIQEAEGTTQEWSPGYQRTVQTMVQLRDGLDARPKELAGLRVKWRNPATPSAASAADAMLKNVQALPWLAESDVAIESLGLDPAQVEQAKRDRKRLQGVSTLRTALTTRATSSGATLSSVPPGGAS